MSALPPAIEAKARLLLLDSLGCILAGLGQPEQQRLNRALATCFPGPLHLPGMAAPLGPAGLAALCAAAMCADEACEGLAEAHGRPGLAVVPVVLAMGCGRPLRDLLAALVAGYEMAARAGIAWRIRPGMHVDGSWHALGAAVAAASLAGLDEAEAAAAAQHAACQVPFSLYLPIARGMTARNLYPAHAALLGLLAAAGQQAGMKAPADALAEARRLALGLESPPPAIAPDRALILDAYIKPFAGVRHVHYAAAAALALRPCLSGPIRRIRLETYGEALRYCANRVPQSAIAAQFSLSFAVAAALVLGDLGPEAYRQLGHPDLILVEALVETAEDFALTRAGRRGATLRIATKADEYTHTVTEVAGDPAQPMPRDAVLAKFLRYEGGALGGQAQALADAVLEGAGSATLPLPAREGAGI